jgi:primosomal protein N' (replication factor Y)
MVTKGLDFENVTLVGVLNADLTLYSDNFRSSEVTFSQITQVIGRAGRRNVQGRAIIQTLTPDSRVLEFCKTADYEGFYNYEIGMRKLLIYPPFCDLATLTISSIYEDIADKFSLELLKIIKQKLNMQKEVKVIILGPAKPSVYLINNKYRNRIILKCKNNYKLRNFISQVIFDFNRISKGRKASLAVDINPSDLI